MKGKNLPHHYPRKLPLRELAEQAMLLQVVQAGALVNAQGDILYLHGRTGMYLELSPGESGPSNILKMAREGLRPDLTIALHKAVGTSETVCCPGLRVRTNGEFTLINLTVRPVATAQACTEPRRSEASPEPSLYLVILEQAPEPAAGGRESNPSTEQAGMDADTRVAELKRELQAKEEYLQTANEELETSNEELKSSNEEMQSVNEELQSSNEELATVNAEMQTKVADLSRSNNDMNNLLAGTGIATIFVDIRLRILRFTPAATKIINLIPSDIGRPVGHVVSNLPGYATLTADTQAVLDTLIPKQLDVRSADGRCYTMRILPYRTMDNVIEGAVLTFVDITESKQAEAPIRASDERLRVALSATSIVLFTQDTDLRYTWMHNPNPGFRTEHVIGKTDADLLPHEEAAALTAIKQQVLKGGKGVRQNVRITIEGKTLIYDLTIEPRRDAVGAIIGITCASLNITGKQR